MPPVIFKCLKAIYSFRVQTIDLKETLVKNKLDGLLPVFM